MSYFLKTVSPAWHSTCEFFFPFLSFDCSHLRLRTDEVNKAAAVLVESLEDPVFGPSYAPIHTPFNKVPLTVSWYHLNAYSYAKSTGYPDSLFSYYQGIVSQWKCVTLTRGLPFTEHRCWGRPRCSLWQSYGWMGSRNRGSCGCQWYNTLTGQEF
jgi:hypothetical protein